jgi:two-component system, chemotaxis family, protein-glutamate methylesterase/glutaminase
MRKNRIGPIRVLVVEDSVTARELLIALFNQCADIEVIGTAQDGVEAVRRALELKPDVITMDIHMPRLNGLEATRQILRSVPIPIVMVTASLRISDIDLSFEAMKAGALSIVKKPSIIDPLSCSQMIQTVRLMADVPVVRRWIQEENGIMSRSGSPPIPAKIVEEPSFSRSSGAEGKFLLPEFQNKCWQVVGFASSTGGPSALVSVLKQLSSRFPLPILVVQHITNGFAQSLAEWLNKELALSVRLAAHGESLRPGTVLISPDDRHMEISLQGTVILNDRPPYKGLRPSANFLFSSLAEVYGTNAIGAILTGMGDDGVDGLAVLHQKGGLVLAQDECTSVVYGMPREAVRRKVVDYVLPVDQIGPALRQLEDIYNPAA